MDGRGLWREDARNEELKGVVAGQEFIESLTTASMPSQSNQQEMTKKKTDNRTEDIDMNSNHDNHGSPRPTARSHPTLTSQ